MTTIQSSKGVALSANASANGWPAPALTRVRTPGAGDFAERKEGRARRDLRKAKRDARFAWLNG